MHNFPRIFALKKQHKSMDLSQSPNRKSTDQSPSPRRLVRRNAAKNFEYTPSASSSTSPSASGSSAPRSRSLDLPYDENSTSFRIEGKEGELNSICELLGLSGPEDFEIPQDAYELMKSKSSPTVIQHPRKDQSILSNHQKVRKSENNKFVEPLPHRCGNSTHTIVVEETETDSGGNDRKLNAVLPMHINVSATVSKGGGINGDRPPLLTPPPVRMPLPDDNCSTWELVGGFAPQYSARSEVSDEHINGEEATGVRIGATLILSGSSSFSTNNDDDSSSTTTEAVSIISPNSGCRINITQWDHGHLLGRGSFGTVYEGISSEGIFFAVKEVSLLEQGSQGKQSIGQLEQEIELLSRFEHENIVRYLGTHKDDSNLYIFLELVTQGSLASLYQKYRLRDSHVSAYTRQILMGLKYLHEKDVIHRDIKCANILVASNGTVKLADFGLAKATRLNDLKSCKGTAFWMAPEVIYSKNQGYGLAADIWSLGCTVLEMLTGHVPYYPLECPQALFRIGQRQPPPIPDTLSIDARDFIEQCLRVNPSKRPTAAELLEHPYVQRPLQLPLGSESPMMPAR